MRLAVIGSVLVCGRELQCVCVCQCVTVQEGTHSLGCPGAGVSNKQCGYVVRES